MAEDSGREGMSKENLVNEVSKAPVIFGNYDKCPKWDVENIKKTMLETSACRKNCWN